MLTAVEWGSEADTKLVISLAPQREVVLLDFGFFFLFIFSCVSYIGLSKTKQNMCLCTKFRLVS